MKPFTYTLLFLILFVGIQQISFGHSGHNHEPAVEPAPHGGMLRNAPPFKSEVVLNKDTVKLYIYDENLKPVKLDKKQLKGDVQFPRKEKKPITFELKKDHYHTTIPGITKTHRFDMHVQLEAGDKKALADFGIDNLH